MKVQVVSDKKGKIVSVGYMDQPYNVEDGVAFSFGPLADDGQAVVELDAPDEFVGRPLTDVTLANFVERIQADLDAKKYAK